MAERYRIKLKDSIKGIETKEAIESAYQSAIEEADKQRRKAYEERDNLLKKYVVYLDLKRNDRHTGYVSSEFDPEDFYWEEVITPVENVNELYLFNSYSEAKDAMDSIINQVEDMSYQATENGDETNELKVLTHSVKQVKDLLKED